MKSHFSFPAWLVLSVSVLVVNADAQPADPIISTSGLTASQQVVRVTVFEPTSGAALHYTLDGSIPTASSPSLGSNATFLIPRNATLNVQAFQSPTSTSSLATYHYGAAATTAVGTNHTLVLKNDGTVWAWGDNASGELGNGGASASSSPVQVTISGRPLANVVAVAAGNGTSFAVNANGNVWAWGANTHGELGFGPTGNVLAPVQISSLGGILAVASAGEHSLALKNDGSLWAWGADESEQAGTGSIVTWITSPMQVSAPTGQAGKFSNAVAVAVGPTHSLALDNQGKVWAWGTNASGQLGNGDSTLATKSAPVAVTSGGTALSPVVALAAGKLNSYALKIDGTAWAWGDNTDGQLGNGEVTVSPLVVNATPSQITHLSGIVSIANRFAIDSSSLWGWGGNDNGELSIGMMGDFASIPLVVALNQDAGPTLSPISDSQTISPGDSTTLFLSATNGGVPDLDALVTFFITGGTGWLTNDPAEALISQILQVRTDDIGNAFVFYQSTPDFAGTAHVAVTSGSSQADFTVASTHTVPVLPPWGFIMAVGLVFGVAVNLLTRQRNIP